MRFVKTTLTFYSQIESIGTALLAATLGWSLIWIIYPPKLEGDEQVWHAVTLGSLIYV